ncbi:MAG: hypothetical protein HY360_27005 [Verrucomicrobia bacterium]|nr:hypothetical protein [Verrucomicrobiota bacterium]
MREDLEALPDTIGIDTGAADFMAEMVEANPGQVIIVATGSLTNIAGALQNFGDGRRLSWEGKPAAGIATPTPALPNRQNPLSHGCIIKLSRY